MIKEPAPVGLAFSGVASHGNCVYIVGGRENLYTGDGPGLERSWKHSVATMEYCSTRSVTIMTRVSRINCFISDIKQQMSPNILASDQVEIIIIQFQQ